MEPTSYTLTVKMPDGSTFTYQGRHPYAWAFVYHGPENLQPAASDPEAWRVQAFLDEDEIAFADAYLDFTKGLSYAPGSAARFTGARFLRVTATASDLPAEEPEYQPRYGDGPETMGS